MWRGKEVTVNGVLRRWILLDLLQPTFPSLLSFLSPTQPSPSISTYLLSLLSFSSSLSLPSLPPPFLHVPLPYTNSTLFANWGVKRLSWVFYALLRTEFSRRTKMRVDWPWKTVWMLHYLRSRQIFVDEASTKDSWRDTKKERRPP